MNKYILILFIVTVLTGLIGFNYDFAGTTAVRMTFLVAADIMIILLFGKLLFYAQGTNKKRRKIREARVTS